MAALAGAEKVAKKKADAAPKRYGTLIRVSDAFAEALRDAVGLDKSNVAEFCDRHLLPVVQRHYREAVIRKARQLEGDKK